jgi:hypothetical protein
MATGGLFAWLSSIDCAIDLQCESVREQHDQPHTQRLCTMNDLQLTMRLVDEEDVGEVAQTQAPHLLCGL